MDQMDYGAVLPPSLMVFFSLIDGFPKYLFYETVNSIHDGWHFDHFARCTASASVTTAVHYNRD